MGNGSNALGYTIVEVMIFLAVSGLMFVIAASFISGKQGTAQFKQSVNQLASTLQQEIDGVGNGQYNNFNQLSCTSSASGLNITASSQNTGSNNGCILLGKVIQFDYTSNLQQYNVYTVAGSQYDMGGSGPTLATSYDHALPTVVDPISGSAVNLTDTKNTEWNVDVTKMVLDSPSFASEVVDPTNAIPISGIGFYNSLGSYNGDGDLNSGIEPTVAIPFQAVGSPAENNLIGEIQSPLSYNPLYIRTSLEVEICLQSGTKYAIVTIGGANGERLTTASQIYTSAAQWHGANC
jgi:type II secretory pathway pseudopilin PulG